MLCLSINPSIKGLSKTGSPMLRSNSLYLWLKYSIKAKISQKRYIFYGLFDGVYQFGKTTLLLLLFRTIGHALNVSILDSFLFLRQIYGLNHKSWLNRYDKAFIDYAKAVLLSAFPIYIVISLPILNELLTIAPRILLMISLHNIYK
jgi:hypothetical protein